MFKSNRIRGLDIGSSRITIAEFAVGKPTGFQLLNYGIAELGIEPDGDADASAYIVTAIRDLMRQKNIRPAPLLMTMSGQSVFPRYVKLPPVTKDKIQQIVQYEAEQNVPFPIDEVVWDYQLVPGEGGEINAMLVAVKTENVTRLTDCVQAAGMEPDIVDAAPLALYNTVRYNYPDLQGCTMVLDIGSRSTNLILIEESKIFIRSIPVAGNAITQELMKEFELSFKDAEELKKTDAFVAFGGVYAGPDNEVADKVSKIVRNVITRLHSEVNRSINFYRSQQGGNPPSRVLLCGGTSIIPHTDTFFRERLKVEVDYLNPFANVPVSPSIDVEKLSAEAHMMGEVVGLALRMSLKCPVEINLMPPDLVAKKVFRKRQPFFAVSIAGIILIMLCWWGYTVRMHGVINGRLKKVEDKIAVLRTVQGQLSEVIEGANGRKEAESKITKLMGLVQMETQWLEIMDAIHSCMPEGMWLTSVSPVMGDDDVVEYVEIAGFGFEDKLKNIKTETATSIEVFRNKLREMPLFNEKTDIKTQMPPGSGAYALEFKIWIGLKKPIKLNLEKAEQTSLEHNAGE